ncbi:MAG: hypothetical protein SFX73_38900 [Kofleriaceae bacterium]|nr:hypothetical protein [Kofleriaceae bacterium]
MRTGFVHATVLAFALAASSACTDEEVGDDSWSDCGGKCDDGTGAVPALNQPELVINDLGVLGTLERAGYDLASHLGGTSTNNAMLVMSSPAYGQLVSTIEADLRDVQAADPTLKVGLASGHRLFDARWLRAASSSFRLVGITNRTDRMHATPGACGEVRFVYRLGYTSSKGSSRLPMTMLVVHEQPMVGGSCAAAARAWQGMTQNADELRTGPLAALGPASRIEINLQSVRWPAAVRPDMGGHAEYLLRVFGLSGGAIAPMRLSNTISTTLTAAQKSALRTWIVANLDNIDDGTAEVPDEFLATRAFSVSPRGLARGANRPYLQAFPNPEQAFADVSFAGLDLVKTPGGLLRRLDTMTCQGCHQSRGLAGFHFLGQEDAETPRSNAIEVGTSPHLHEELRWRRTALADVASTGTIATARPFADRNAAAPGQYGAHCGLGDASFAAWTCATGYTCKDLSGDEVGMCVPAEKLSAGDACETSSLTFETNPHKDRVTDMKVEACSVPSGIAARCSRSVASGSVGGFPNGSCTASCLTMGAVGGAAICGAEPPSGFNDCIGQGKPFAECLANAKPQFRRRCDAGTPCGDDYVCSGVPGAPKGVGACMPPYFIFQARVDGHPAP